MAYPIEAYYGRKTYALLDECCFCGKPYADTGEWHTVQGGRDKMDTWLIICDECHKKLEEQE